MIYRQFKLQTDRGTIALDVKGERFLSNPSGLGVSRNNTYAKVGNDYVISKTEMSQGKFSCDMIFDDYDAYKSFMTYCLLNGKTTLIYTLPDSNIEYMRDVDVGECKKGEIEEGKLKCPTTFNFLTNWYKYKTYTTEDDDNDGICTLPVRNEGHIPCGFILQVGCKGTGKISNIDFTELDIGDNIIINPCGAWGDIRFAFVGDTFILNTIDTELMRGRKTSTGLKAEKDLIAQNYYTKIPVYSGSETTIVAKTIIALGSGVIPTLSVMLREEFLFV